MPGKFFYMRFRSFYNFPGTERVLFRCHIVPAKFKRVYWRYWCELPGKFLYMPNAKMVLIPAESGFRIMRVLTAGFLASLEMTTATIRTRSFPKRGRHSERSEESGQPENHFHIIVTSINRVKHEG
jgi:hypothetical protein